MINVNMSQHVRLSTEMAQAKSFGSTCIPLTTELAVVTKDYILPKLKGIPSKWTFPDRVLAWLAPSLYDDIRSYYETTDGIKMLDIYQNHQVEHLDKSLLSILISRLDNIKPGILG
jgi:hypothetical protein